MGTLCTRAHAHRIAAPGDLRTLWLHGPRVLPRLERLAKTHIARDGNLIGRDAAFEEVGELLYVL